MKFGNLHERVGAVAPMRVTLYHGTQLGKLSSVLAKGLLNTGTFKTWRGAGPVTTMDYHQSSIFLTPEKSIAARYGMGPQFEERPIVLEVVISTARRLRKVLSDPMDRPENALDDYDGSFNDGLFDDEMKSLTQFVEEFARQYWPGARGRIIPAHWDEAVHENGLQSIDGFNIYKHILSVLARRMNPADFRRERQGIVRALHTTFDNETFGSYLSISNDGVLRVHPNAVSNADQVSYPKRVPVAAIKAVWVRDEEYRRIFAPFIKSTDTDQFGAKNLPSEETNTYDRQEVVLGEIKDYFEDECSAVGDPDFDMDQLRDNVGDFLKSAEELWEDDSVDFYQALASLDVWLKANPDNAKANADEKLVALIGDVVKKVEDEFDYRDPADPWNPKTKHHAVWYRIDLSRPDNTAKVKAALEAGKRKPKAVKADVA